MFKYSQYRGVWYCPIGYRTYWQKAEFVNCITTSHTEGEGIGFLVFCMFVFASRHELIQTKIHRQSNIKMQRQQKVKMPAFQGTICKKFVQTNNDISHANKTMVFDQETHRH